MHPPFGYDAVSVDAIEDEKSEPSEWRQRAQLAQQLWDEGNNAELARVLDRLEKAHPEEREALYLAVTLRRRMRPDPVAIALWLLTLGVFCLLTYLFVLR